MKKRSVISVIVSLILVFAMSVNVFAATVKTASDIASEAEYRVRTLSDGTKTVDIIVSVENNPQLSDILMIYDVSKEMFDNQKELDDGTYSLMSIQHIVGELALHVVVYNLTSMVGAQDADNRYNSYYEDAKDALLNIDETRLSATEIEIAGSIVICLGTLFEAFSAK